MPILVATDREVIVIDVERSTPPVGAGNQRPSYLPRCGRPRLRTGVVWDPAGRRVQNRRWRTVLVVSRPCGPADYGHRREPRRAGCRVGGHGTSEVWLSADAGTTWEQTSRLETLSSSSEWSFPPRPDTHHVRWIACHPLEPARLWVAIEAGALVPPSMAAAPGATGSLAGRGTPTNSLFIAMHPIPCASLRATDISRATTPARRGTRQAPVSRSPTCAASRSIRGSRTSSWYQRRPDRTSRTWLANRMAGCIADSLPSAGSASATVGQSHPAQSRRCSAPARNRGEMWAADERGVHRSDDGGKSWRRIVGYATSPQHLRGLALLQ